MSQPPPVMLLLYPSALRERLCQLLQRQQHRPIAVNEPAEARAALAGRQVSGILVDVDLLGANLAERRASLSELAGQAPTVAAGSVATLAPLLSGSGAPPLASLLFKPFDPEEAVLQVLTMLRGRPAQAAAVQRRPAVGAGPFRDAATLQAVRCLLVALEAKDLYTLNHSRMVAHMAALTARAMNLTAAAAERIRLAGLLHDVGMVAVRQEVLNKPGPLTLTERQHVSMHPVVSERMLSPLHELHDLLAVVRHHHERFDGSGYPDRLAGARIPLWSRILAVADTYDALISVRAYRGPISPEAALHLIQGESGTQFDPRVVASFAGVAARSLCRPATVLLVQDADSSDEACAAALQADGHQVHLASTPQEVRSALEAGQFEVAIIDPAARATRGFSLAQILRKERPGLPIIIWTALTGLQDDMALWELDVASFVPKPTSPELLRQEVRRALMARQPLWGLSLAPGETVQPFSGSLRS